jgi:hypothetical protein
MNMEIRNVGSNTTIQPQSITESAKKESVNIQKTNVTDTVSISSEAIELFNEGGGHPDRPIKL